MNKDEYQTIQEQLIFLGSLIKDLDLVGFIQSIDHAEAIGPIVDPSLFIRASVKMEQIKQLAKAARIFQQEVHRQVEVHIGALHG